MDEFLALEAINSYASRSIEWERFTIEHIEFPVGNTELYLFDDYPTWLMDGYGKGPHGFYFNTATYLPTEFRSLILFKQGGQLFTRFFIHPEDAVYGNLVKAYLTGRGIPYQSKREYKAQRTASRSMIIFDHVSGHQISYRPSTSGTLKDRRSRPNPIHWAHLSRGLSDYFMEQSHRLKVLKIAPEAGAYGFPTTTIDGKFFGDITAQLRLMDEVSSGDKRQFSGFILKNKEQLARIAKRADMSVREFKRVVYNLIGQAQVELSLILGFHYTSAHGQNFRVELTKDGKLTGRIVLLDLTDGRPIAEIFERNGQKTLIEQWDRLAGKTNPVHRNGSIGISSFTTPRLQRLRKTMIAGAFARMAEIGNVPKEVYDLVETVYSSGHSDKGFTAVVPSIHLCSQLAQNKVDFRDEGFWRF